MNRWKSYVWMAAGCAALALIAGVFTAGPAVGQLVKAVLMANVDERGRIPYEVSSSGGGTIFFPGPRIGKRLVITNVNVFVQFPTNPGQVVQLLLGHSTGGRNLYLPPTWIGTTPSPGFDQYVVNQQVLTSFDPGDQPIVVGASGGVSNGAVTISGYLLDCSAAPCAAIQ